MNNNTTNEAKSVTTAIAAASPSPNSDCSSFVKINIGITFSHSLVINITEPYSPDARAKASAKPVKQRRQNGRQNDAAQGLPARRAQAGRGLLDLHVHVF